MSLMMMALLACADKAGDTAELDDSFAAVRDEVLLPSCAFSSCHGAGAGGLTLDEAGSYEALVEVESLGAPGEVLVIPGDADGSYLIKKMTAASGIVGDPMPPDALVDDLRLEQVRSWIDRGAPND